MREYHEFKSYHYKKTKSGAYTIFVCFYDHNLLWFFFFFATIIIIIILLNLFEYCKLYFGKLFCMHIAKTSSFEIFIYCLYNGHVRTIYRIHNPINNNWILWIKLTYKKLKTHICNRKYMQKKIQNCGCMPNKLNHVENLCCFLFVFLFFVFFFSHTKPFLIDWKQGRFYSISKWSGRLKP